MLESSIPVYAIVRSKTEGGSVSRDLCGRNSICMLHHPDDCLANMRQSETTVLLYMKNR